MKIYYSSTTRGFFHEGIQDDIPLDCVQISQDLYEDLLIGLSNGMIVVNVNGKLSLSMSTPVENTSEIEGFWINSEMSRVRDELEKVQDSDPSAVGTVLDWRNYRKALRAWPENIKFPEKDFRPSAPDFKL